MDLLNPCGTMPDIFQWTQFVTRKPPSAKENLYGSQRNSNQYTIGCASVQVHAQSVAVVYERPQYGLHDVVGQTHASHPSQAPK